MFRQLCTRIRELLSSLGHGSRLALPVSVAVVFASLAHAGTAKDRLKGRTDAAAEAALGKYLASYGEVPRTAERIEIHAALSKLDKTGCMRAVRIPAPAGENRYEFVQLTGDSAVKEQLILGYLKAKERLSEMPAAALAITPANYTFFYKGAVDDGELQAYVFQITPRRKRDGLIEGELWLDQRTGVPIRRSGRLVKSPSMLFRNIVVTQDDTVHNGAVESRLTHITLEIRQAGRAEVVVAESPLGSADVAQIVRFPRNDGYDQQGF